MKVSIEEELQGVAETSSKDLPKMVNDETRLEKVSASGKAMHYVFTLTKYSSTQLDKEKTHSILETGLINSQCARPDMVEYLKKGVSNHFTYFGNDGEIIFEIIISKESCKKSTLQ